MNDAGDDPVIRETARFPMRAEIEIMFEGLYGWDSEHGKETSATVDIELAWSKTSDGGWTAFTASQWQYRNLTRAKSTQMRFLAEIDFPANVFTKAGDPVFIKATRKTRMYTGNYRDRVYLSAIRTKQYNPNKSDSSQLTAAKNINDGAADKFCRLGIKIKANINTKENLDRFNVIASMTGRTALGCRVNGVWTWNGQWSPKIKTSNSAAVLLELITGLIHEPSKHKDSELGLASFGKLYEFCMNRKVEIEGQGLQDFTLECNGVLTSGTRKIDAINSILATCDGGLYVNEFGKIGVYYEDTQTAPIGLLNPQRIISMVDQRSLERKADGYTVEFIDQDSDFIQKTHKILRRNIAVNPGLNTYTPVKLDYTTSYNQAMWHARRLLAKEEHRPGEIKCTVGKEGRYYKPGSLIKLQHERFKIGLGSGEITQLIRDGDKIVGLKLMERFDISKERDYWIEYYVVDVDRNHVVTKQIQSVGQYTDKLMFTVPLDMDSPDVPVFGNILSAMYGEKTETPRVWEAKRYIVTGLSENENGYDLTLAEYAEDIYRTGVVQERQSSILSAPPMVFADQQRNEQQLLLEALQAQTAPQVMDSIARNIVGSALSAYDETVKRIADEIAAGTLSSAEEIAKRLAEEMGELTLEEANKIAQQIADDMAAGLLVSAEEIARRIAEEVAKLTVATNTPKFKGVFYNVDVINGTSFNLNDWIYFAGTSTGVAPNRWEYGYIYQWKATGWTPIPKPSTVEGGQFGWMYLDAVSSMVEGMPDGMFGDVFCKALTATTAFIDSLFARNIEISNNGSIKTQGFTDRDGTDNGKPGFKLVFNKVNGIMEGLIETNNIRTKGMDAVDMTATNGIFTGSISGRLTNGGHFNISNNHLIYGSMTFQQLYNRLLNMNIISLNDYEFVLCAGYIEVTSYTDSPIVLAQYIWKSYYNPGTIYIEGIRIRDNKLSPIELSFPGNSPNLSLKSDIIIL